LIEFLKKEKGIRLFDLLLYNEGENRVILIECKSSVGENQKAQDTLKQIEESKKFVIGKIEYLSECFGIELNPERFEYVSCIYVEDSDKFFQSRSAQEGKAVKKYDPNLVKFWVYIRHNKSVKLHHSQTHSSKDLTRLLIRGFELSELTPHYDLSFYLNMHPFRLILNAIVGYCYNSNLHSSSQDPKKIKKGEIVKLLNSKIRLSAPDNEKKALVEEKVNSIIAYGERYGLFEIISKDEIRIQCYGVQLNTVIDNIKRKYFERWIEEKSEQRCKKRALEQFTQQYYPAHYRRLDYFDPNIDPEIIVAKKSRD
jgi:hypothetical protein